MTEKSDEYLAADAAITRAGEILASDDVENLPATEASSELLKHKGRIGSFERAIPNFSADPCA
jgi:hypothetical protein